MSKRSNLFQRVAKYLFQTITPAGGSVTESALLFESASGIEREIDILVDVPTHGSSFKMAVEVRGRAAKDDIQWVDCLVGKYTDLPVQKVVAVSRSGFSSAAQAKAKAKGIQLMTAKAFSKQNWVGEFKRLGIAQLSRRDETLHVDAETDLPSPRPIESDDIVTLKNGKVLSFATLVFDAVAVQAESLYALISSELVRLYPSLDDVAREPLETVIVHVLEEAASIAIPGAGTLKLLGLRIRTRSTFSVRPSEVQHYRFAIGSGALVSAASLQIGNRHAEVHVVQTSDNLAELRAFGELLPTPKLKRKQKGQCGPKD